MRKYAVLVIVGFLGLAAIAFATGFGQEIVKIKSDPAQQVDVAFRLFETRNMWNFLLLDTRDGRVWQVQYSVKEDRPAFKVEIPATSVSPAQYSSLFSDTKQRPGRFTLYPTVNIWNFILLDQDTGDTWQCQYAVGEENFAQIIHIPLSQ